MWLNLLIMFVFVCASVPMAELQEREGKKDMEPRSEDAKFEEVTVQQLPQLERGGSPVSTQTNLTASCTAIQYISELTRAIHACFIRVCVFRIKQWRLQSVSHRNS